MDGHHTPGTEINFLFWRICRSCSLSISLFISYIRINIHGIMYFIYAWFGFYLLCLTNIISVLFVLIILLYVCVYMYMLKLFLCGFWWFMFIAYVYVCRHNYIFYFAFICLHVFLLCHSRAVNIFTNFTFWIWTWYVNILRKRKHGRLERHRPLNMGSQVWNYRTTSLGAGTLRRFIIGAYKLERVSTE
jgi:hypothetical protein